MKLITSILVFLILQALSFGQIYNVGEQTLTYTDSSRNRPIKVELWYPTLDIDSQYIKTTELPYILPPTIRGAIILDESLPLILLSHGTGGNRFSLAWLAIELAKNGFIVVAPDHWGNTYDNKIPEYFVRYWERPLDISFILTRLIEDDDYNSYIDMKRVGLIGFSFGGYTALSIAGVEVDCELLKDNAKTKEGKKELSVPELGDLRDLIYELPCTNIPNSFKDSRFTSFIAMAPALGLGLPNREQKISSPLLIIGVEDDRIAPIKTNALKYHELISKSDFLILKDGAGHYIFLNEGDQELKKVAKKYYRDRKGLSRAQIHNKISTDIISYIWESWD